MVSTCVVSLPNPNPNPCFLNGTATLFRLGGRYEAGFAKRNKGQKFRVLANPSGYTSENNSSSKMLMVDPLEAKRLAAIQMKEIQARDRLKRFRRIEAINGAWAMIGLTAGLVIEGQTGKSILDQLAEYWSSVESLFVQYVHFPWE